MGEALANYNNPNLLSETCSAGQLRRLECAWAIEQAIILTYQLQNEPTAVSERLISLQDKIRQDCLQVVDNFASEEELDFLFPEITRIHNHDLLVLNIWQNQVDWLRSLPASELELLAILPTKEDELVDNDKLELTLGKPEEIILYEESRNKSHVESLADQLRFMMSSDLRDKYEIYVSEQAAISGHKVLYKENLQEVSHLTVANLYWYFKVRDEANNKVTT